MVGLEFAMLQKGFVMVALFVRTRLYVCKTNFIEGIHKISDLARAYTIIL